MGGNIRNYLQGYGISVQMDGRPLPFNQRVGNRVFQPMQSKDVPWYVAEYGDYGITGEDLVANYLLGNIQEVQVLDRLGFGKGDLVVFAPCDAKTLKQRLRRPPRVAVPNYYRNIVEGSGERLIMRKGQAVNVPAAEYVRRWTGQAVTPVEAYLRDTFGEFDIVEVSGTTERFLGPVGGTSGRSRAADIGIDFTTYFKKPAGGARKTTIGANGLKILERIMETEAVAIAGNGSWYTKERYDRMLRGRYPLDWKKMDGLVPVTVQDASSGDVLMLGYANQNALDETRLSGLATFWSRSRNELWTKGLTSGNTMRVEEVRSDCDNDALLYRVRPNGPACHTGAASCFFRSIKSFKRTEGSDQQ